MASHLIITSTHPAYPAGTGGAACPTGNTLDELRDDLAAMLAALNKPIIDQSGKDIPASGQS